MLAQQGVPEQLLRGRLDGTLPKGWAFINGHSGKVNCGKSKGFPAPVLAAVCVPGSFQNEESPSWCWEVNFQLLAKNVLSSTSLKSSKSHTKDRNLRLLVRVESKCIYLLSLLKKTSSI